MVWLAVVYSIVLIRVQRFFLIFSGSLRDRVGRLRGLFRLEIVRGTLIMIISWMLHYKHIAVWECFRNSIMSYNKKRVQTFWPTYPTVYSLEVYVLYCMEFFQGGHDTSIFLISIRGVADNWHTDHSLIGLIIFIETDFQLIYLKYRWYWNTESYNIVLFQQSIISKSTLLKNVFIFID